MLTVNEEGITAEVLSSMVGVSRSTARRYLEYLISGKKVHAELIYGSVGRPERRYFLVFFIIKTVEDLFLLLFLRLILNNPNYNASNQHHHCRSNCPQ